MDPAPPSVHTPVPAVHTIPDLSPDGLALVLFFMGFILLVLMVDLMVKLCLKWRLVDGFREIILIFINYFSGSKKLACFPVWKQMKQLKHRNLIKEKYDKSLFKD